MTEVAGFCDERFRPLEDVLRDSLDAGIDEGVSLAATLHGELVVDLWGGTRDRERERPWERDTIARVFSTSKVPVVLSTLLLVDRGLLDIHERVAAYWPRFGQHGKERATVLDVLTHRSGLPGFGQEITLDDAYSWDRLVRIVEDADAWFEPGTRTCYQPITFGVLLGELVRRRTGVPLVEFFRAELAEPLDVDFHFAITESADAARIAQLWAPPTPLVLPTPMAEAIFAEVERLGPWPFARSHLGLVLPASSGIGNARALARLGSVIACRGEVGGRRLLSEQVVDLAVQEHSHDVDEIMGEWRVGLGLGLHSAAFPGPSETSAFWGGFGGSLVVMDAAAGAAFAFVPNRLLVSEQHGNDERSQRIWDAISCVLPRL